MESTMEKNDILVERNTAFVNTLKNDTGYPNNLTEKQVLGLIYFFGSRKISFKAMDGGASKTREFTSQESMFIKDAFSWFGFVAGTPDERKRAYRALTMKFKITCDFLRHHPSFVTPLIYRALEDSGYKDILKNFVLVVDKDRKMQVRAVSAGQKQQMIPFGKLEELLWDFQNVAIDKIMLMVRAITPEKVKKEKIGTLSKGIRDLQAAMHMVRQGNKNPNMALTQININTADSKEKMQSYSNYVVKNREQ